MHFLLSYNANRSALDLFGWKGGLFVTQHNISAISQQCDICSSANCGKFRQQVIVEMLNAFDCKDLDIEIGFIMRFVMQ